ncbi:RNA-directed DNA polymerase-like protein [Cardamine amara subsp. amara]|uniref:RNA-directed DNA polymerase-like protein n=1 Tax=Cardamine amara subsp. amara TaxID=228776 RepID=A0ABD1BBY0_CARAN
MPYSIAVGLGMTDFTPTCISLILADRSVRIPEGLLDDVPVRIGECMIPTDFIILKYNVEPKDPLILGRHFLATAGALIDLKGGKISLTVGNLVMNFDMDELVKLPTIDGHTYYVDTLNDIVAGYVTMLDANISPELCMHRIHLEDETKSSIEHQRRLNLNLKEVVKKEIMKLLEAGIIYPISDSDWVSPVHVVPKKGGVTVIKNEKNELIPMRTVTGHRMCIDYRKLNAATRNNHFPLPFIDQMLERLANHSYYCFLDGYSGFFQIPIHPEDQEKTTFTCPYGTFAYRRMLFWIM